MMAPLAHRLAAPRPQRRRDTCRSSPAVPALQASDRPPCPESRRPRQHGDRAARSAYRACRFPCRPCRMACLSRPLSRLQGTAFAAAGGRFRSEEWSRLTGTRRELGCSRPCSWGRGGLPIMGMGRRWRRPFRPVGISGFSKCILRPGLSIQAGSPAGDGVPRNPSQRGRPAIRPLCNSPHSRLAIAS